MLTSFLIVLKEAVSVLSLKPLDVEFMKQLHDKVNIIPVIGKADTLTPEELKAMKQRVRVCQGGRGWGT